MSDVAFLASYIEDFRRFEEACYEPTSGHTVHHVANDSFITFIDNEADIYKLCQYVVRQSLCKDARGVMIVDDVKLRQYVRRLIAFTSTSKRWSAFVSDYTGGDGLRAQLLLFHVDIDKVTYHLRCRYEEERNAEIQ